MSQALNGRLDSEAVSDQLAAIKDLQDVTARGAAIFTLRRAPR